MKASTLALGMKVNLGSTRHQVLRFPFNTRTGTASYVRYINTKVFYGLSTVDTASNTLLRSRKLKIGKKELPSLR